jgi:hypothetical protein
LINIGDRNGYLTEVEIGVPSKCLKNVDDEIEFIREQQTLYKIEELDYSDKTKIKSKAKEIKPDISYEDFFSESNL